MSKIKLVSSTVLAALLTSGCAHSMSAAQLAEKRAACEKMESEMGVNSVHDHSEQKGGAAGTMNLTHDQCRRILAK